MSNGYYLYPYKTRWLDIPFYYSRPSFEENYRVENWQTDDERARS